MKKINLSEHLANQSFEARPYQEILRETTMSAGVYVLPAGEQDPQSPHTEDEIYYIIAGAANFSARGESLPVQPGDVLFVPAGMPHKFTDIQLDLVVLVIFSPPENG